MKKDYYFIYLYYAEMRVSPLELKAKKQIPYIETCAVIDKHPFEWMLESRKNSNIILKFYHRLSLEEYEYFKRHFDQKIPADGGKEDQTEPE